jgi:MscS family membrane protein
MRGINVAVALALFFLPRMSWAQVGTQGSVPPVPQPETPQDTLGRTTPRGAVLGFLSAMKKNNAEVGALYLNTPLRGADAARLAGQLGTVLDRRLPARLNQISDKPEGSIPDPLRPDEDLVGTIDTASGELNITVERVDRGKAGKVWLFSGQTLSSIPDVFQELATSPLEQLLPKFMVSTLLAGIPLFEWLALFIGMPLLYMATGILNRALSWLIGALRRHVTHNATLKNPRILRVPVRLLLVALVIRLVLASVALPLLARQFWSTVALFIVVVACVWWLLLLTGTAEAYVVRHRLTVSGSASVLRLFRRLIDGLLLFGGFLFVLYHFGINLTAALAGLGVGGIAIALAAQKTLENVIAGVSLIADEAVRVGDFLNLGDVQGTVEGVGLRSTRIRTLDRTIVSLPNGQIANMRLETLSVRDKFWFHPMIALRYETTRPQLKSVLTGVHQLLRQQPNIDPASVRVRLIRFGTFSLEIDIFAYTSAHDWNDFLELQEELLFGIIDIVHGAGTGFAFPSQTLYLASEYSDNFLSRFRSATQNPKLTEPDRRHESLR